MKLGIDRRCEECGWRGTTRADMIWFALVAFYVVAAVAIALGLSYSRVLATLLNDRTGSLIMAVVAISLLVAARLVQQRLSRCHGCGGRRLARVD